jgi:hypothetical protein
MKPPLRPREFKGLTSSGTAGLWLSWQLNLNLLILVQLSKEK